MCSTFGEINWTLCFSHQSVVTLNLASAFSCRVVCLCSREWTMLRSRGKVEKCHVWEEVLQSLKFSIKCGGLYPIWGSCIGWQFRKPINVMLSIIDIKLGLLHTFDVLALKFKCKGRKTVQLGTQDRPGMGWGLAGSVCRSVRGHVTAVTFKWFRTTCPPSDSSGC